MKPWRLQAFREECGATQKQMADALEIPFRTYQDWELGTKKPTAAGASLLAFAIGSKAFAQKLRKVMRKERRR